MSSHYSAGAAGLTEQKCWWQNYADTKKRSWSDGRIASSSWQVQNEWSRGVHRLTLMFEGRADYHASILSCVLRGSRLVRAVVQHALIIARYNSVIGSSALFCCERYGCAAADFWRVKLTFLIQIFKKSVIIQLVNRRFVLLGLIFIFIWSSMFSGKGGLPTR